MGEILAVQKEHFPYSIPPQVGAKQSSYTTCGEQHTLRTSFWTASWEFEKGVHYETLDH
jgi:hypothetical protein